MIKSKVSGWSLHLKIANQYSSHCTDDTNLKTCCDSAIFFWVIAFKGRDMEPNKHAWLYLKELTVGVFLCLNLLPYPLPNSIILGNLIFFWPIRNPNNSPNFYFSPISIFTRLLKKQANQEKWLVQTEGKCLAPSPNLMQTDRWTGRKDPTWGHRQPTPVPTKKAPLDWRHGNESWSQNRRIQKEKQTPLHKFSRHKWCSALGKRAVGNIQKEVAFGGLGKFEVWASIDLDTSSGAFKPCLYRHNLRIKLSEV